MQFGGAETQLVYDFLDLSEEEQEVWLSRLKVTSPSQYAQLLPFYHCDTQPLLSQIWSDGAQSFIASQLFEPNTTLDKYRLGEEIGRGGMGVVYRAYRDDSTFEQELAIKCIHPSLYPIIGRNSLFKEAQMLARLSHPCIAKVFDGGISDGCVYIVMEYVDGCTLGKQIATQPTSHKARLSLFVSICSAIEHAHRHQMIHGDIKPDNILIDRDGQAKIIDFNLTQKLECYPSPDSDDGVLAYSESYASPEQKRGEYLTQQTDVYALGKLLAFLLTADGKKPNQELALVITKATEEEADNRYVTVNQLRNDVIHVMNKKPISVKQDNWLYRLRCLVRRRPIPLFLSIVLVVSAFVFSLVLVKKNQQLYSEKQASEELVMHLTQLMFHGKETYDHPISFEVMLDLSRRQILANPHVSDDVKQKLIVAMMVPHPSTSKNEK
ncbi:MULTISPECIES: serine/threonine-protein kinase [unclassified Salinivibrio]|uniref:serine/threonine protein kinase n=1 Tax=unclassified Salinivibrio TaxID=2636825 RepID=UPI000987B0C5|nr:MULTISPECIES: serine/threonine-protein kinase [unclassified Salinivibrio]MPS31906.1 serine/threonine protein kinase [Salinivibrio sp. VYel7]MPX89713.1 serine/threonine protein kinase [Salinivibrio sp. VYel1]MPX93300.1 serine/threonine protein kinase [Salinivibrio sp. VYel9]MPX95873.1 serine/threonine protein kinase [Salinivibrio sp. VYel6]MPX99518.1 serine/threonine protein kinase [Salinivibrio sp. VYel4]MPY02633.1 serine/threonine protein kinase [Salinivibrio sp. VYel5]MPY05486.1 serine/